MSTDHKPVSDATRDDEARRQTKTDSSLPSLQNALDDPRLLFYAAAFRSNAHHLAKLGTLSFSAAVLQLPWNLLVSAIDIHLRLGQSAFRICLLLPSAIAIFTGGVALAVPPADHRRALAGILLGVCFILFGFAMALYA